MLPFDDESVPFQEIELRRFEMERAWQLRQDNILPLETAWNEGRFYGIVLKGAEPFTFFQRVGIFLIGVPAISVGAMIFVLYPVRGSWIEALPDVLIALLGFRVCWVAIRRLPHPSSDADEPEDSQ
jgi:hypothetical protein